MKQIIISLCEDDFDKDAVINAVKNKLKLEGIYDEVFRKHIKYESALRVEFELVWDQLKEYLEE